MPVEEVDCPKAFDDIGELFTIGDDIFGFFSINSA
jgi:hypothetical protein